MTGQDARATATIVLMATGKLSLNKDGNWPEMRQTYADVMLADT